MDFNEIYKHKNSQDFSDDTKKRIYEFTEFVDFRTNLFNVKIADVACGNKFIGDTLCNYYGSSVSSVDYYDFYPIDAEVNKIDLRLPLIFVDDVSSISGYCPNLLKSKTMYDIIIFSHALEHFRNSDMVLFNLKTLMNKNSKLYIVVPNCEYNTKACDKSLGHYKFFTFKKLKNLLLKHFKITYLIEFNEFAGFEELWCELKLKD